MSINNLSSHLEEKQFCEDMLPKTSRTFALSVPLLKGELYWAVLVSYLLCRILDTIEDATTLTAQKKKELLESFGALLKERDQAKEKLWLNSLHREEIDGDPHHKDLLFHFEKVLEVYFSLSETMRKSTLTPILTMAHGMGDFSKALEKNPMKPIETKEDLESYCYYVAGTVGELLTESFSAAHPLLLSKKDKLLPLGRRFGLTLQLVNIMKDVKVDEGREVSFLPRASLKQYGESEKVVLEELFPLVMNSSEDSLNFIHQIPVSHGRVRLFCLWPLWLALATLRKIALTLAEDGYEEKKSIKISRNEVYLTLFWITLISWIPFLLNWDFKRRLSEIEVKRKQAL